MAKAKTKHAAQQAYDKRKSEAGEHIQLNVKLKTAADLAMMKRLRKRFENTKDTAIARLALHELDKRKN